jgi:NAD-dependent DNA ligase
VIDGVKIQFATGYHAKFIVDNAIGVESLVRIVRSGDVIPSIIEVIQKSKEPIMPSSVEYEWNETRVNIFVKNADTNDAYTHQQLLHFYRTMGVENVSVALIKRFIANGYDTIAKIYNISKNELLEMDGIQQTMADKIYENIHNSIDKPLPLEKIMAASLKFGNGFGIRRLKLIVNTYPDIMTADTINISAITNIDGFSTITATQFIAALPEFKTFMTEHPFLIIGDSKNPIKKGKFSGKKILFTGFRDAKIKEYIEKNGGTIANAINKNLDILLIKNADATGSKIMKAKELGIKIMTKDELLI